MELVDALATVAGDGGALATAVTAERLRDIGYRNRTDDEFRRVRDQLTELLDPPPTDPAVRARLLLGRAQTHARLHEPGWGVAATRDYQAAARAFVQADEPDEAAAAIAERTWSVELLVAGLQAARISISEGIDLAGGPSLTASLLSQRAKINLWIGDLERAAEDVAAAWRVEGHLDDLAVAYVAWAEIAIEAALGHPDRVRMALGRAEATVSGWHETVTGVQFDAEVADALAQAGLDDLAWSHLVRAQSRRDEDEDAVLRAELEVHARIGDPDVAIDAWTDVARSCTQEPWDRARLRLLVALAHHHRHDDEAGQVAADAFEQAAVHTQPAMLLRREPGVAALLLPLAADAGSRTALMLHRARVGWRIDLLEGVRLTGPDGTEIPVAGRIGTLLAVLVAADAVAPAARVASIVWPDDADDEVLSARLRRLVHRIRKLAPVVERIGDDQLRLTETTTSDIRELEHAIQRARAADGASAQRGWLSRALAIAEPVDPHDLVRRTDLPPDLVAQLQRQLHWVHRQVADVETDRGRDDRARRHWQRALDLMPDDDLAAVAVARSLLAEGRRADAAEVLTDTLRELTSLGIRPSTTFARLHTSLVTTSTTDPGSAP